MSNKISNRKILIRFALFPLFLGALLFGPANTLNWIAAWIYIIIYLGFGVILVTWMRKNNLGLLKERMTILKSSAKGWDKVIIFLATILFIALFFIIGFDAGRYHWSYAPIILRTIGFISIISSFILIFLVMKENTYLSRIVEIQKERGHSVITTGPYKYVRHPMYVGVIIMFFFTPLALGSIYGLIPALLLIVLIVIRTYKEDRMLHRELQGY
jgi:protein-S-isoprenylcysteine O-methyltransferase Ste14